jgi:hypothetical protein
MKPILILTLAALASPAAAQLPFVETFDGGSNVGGWTLGPPPQLLATGGNPGGYHYTLVDTFAPQPRTSGASVFTGDWRAQGVRSVGIDLRTVSTQFPFDRELTLMLGNDNGTPANTADDCLVYFLGTRRVPQVAEGWRSFDFFVDAASATMPAGWLPYGTCTDPDSAWNKVITDVSYVQYFYGDPTFFFIFDQLPASTYCVAKISSPGCRAAMALSGTPSASSSAPFLLQATQVVSQTNGLLFYGYGPNNKPFQGGTMCVVGPVRRTALQFSGGNSGPADCSGSYAFDFNAQIQSGADPLLGVGQEVFAQYWYRDPASASATGLSDAAQFTIQP